MERELGNKILVTGAGGFIGSHLTEALLKKGHYVRAMVHYNFRNDWGWVEEVLEKADSKAHEKTSLGIVFHDLFGHSELEIVPGDIQDTSFVSSAVESCDTVFHLAALIAIPYSYVAPASYVSTNVQGTLNLLEACRRHNVGRLVHTSTSEVYGTAQYTPIDERHPLVGQSPYSASKIGADHLAESYYRSFDLPVSIIRPFNTFGPRQSARAVVPAIITQVLSGEETIRLGSLTPVRDLSFIADTVAGFIGAAESERIVGQVTNIGRGEGVTVEDLCRMILDICGAEARIETDIDRVRPEKSELLELICDNTRARETFGWQPGYTLKEALEVTIDWFKTNLDRYKPTIYNI